MREREFLLRGLREDIERERKAQDNIIRDMKSFQIEEGGGRRRGK